MTLAARRTGAKAKTRPRPRWYLELAVIGVFYGVYSGVRNQFGSAAVEPAEAQANAELVIGWERSIGLYFERGLQDLFIDWVPFIQFWNLFYGLFHFAVTAFALIWLYWRFPRHYPFWRTTGLFTTGSALAGFALFPLMAPRLLSAGGGLRGRPGRHRLRGHRPRSGRAVVVHLGRGRADLQPVRRHAQPALRLGHVVLPGAAPAPGPAGCEVGPRRLPLAHAVRHRGDRQPLLDRRRRRTGRAGAGRGGGPGATTAGETAGSLDRRAQLERRGRRPPSEDHLPSRPSPPRRRGIGRAGPGDPRVHR